MRQRTLVRVGVAFAAASLVLTASACGSRGSDDGGGDDSGEKVAKIGVISPTSGDLSALGLGIRSSVELAVKQANEDKLIPGWKLEVVGQDDEGKPDVAKNAATKLASDDEVAAVVGTLNSSTSQTVQPVLSSAKILQISPANTNPALTQGADWRTAPKRTYENYYRTCTTDVVQGPFAARYVYNELKYKKVATIHDKKTYGQGLAETFSEEFKKLGGKVVSAQTINPEDKSYDAVISKIKPTNPDIVYYGGEYPQAGPLTQQMKSNGLDVPLIAGDGIYAADYIKLAGKAAPGNYATAPGAPLNKLPAAKEYAKAYKDGDYEGDNSAYGAYSYDATTAILNALKTSLKDAKDVKSTRQATIDAMKDVSFDGVSGKVAFDEYGDTTNKVLTVYEVKGEEFTDVHSEEFK